MSGAIAVPADFFGLASQDWPSTGSVPPFPFGRITNFDNNRTHWRSLHTSGNTINWAALDTFVSGARAAGAVRGTYCLYGCPTFLASTGAGVAGPYGGLGEIAYPNDLAQLTYFCTQFIARNASTWAGFFDQISLFNEPGSVFTSCTTTQFVDMLWTAYAAIKAAAPSMPVLSPGTFDLSSANSGSFWGIGGWLNVAGTVNPTKTGKDCFDRIASHPYTAVPAGRAFSGRGSISSVQLGGILAFRKALDGTAQQSAIYDVTEYGYQSAANSDLALFLAQTPAYRESFVQCLWIDAMLAGVKSMCAWSLDNVSNLMGNLRTDDPGAVSGLRKIYNACAGKTIVAPSGITATGGRFLTFSDGSTYTVAAP